MAPKHISCNICLKQYEDLDYQLRTKLYFAFVHVNLLLKISFQKASDYEEIQWTSLQNSITKLFAAPNLYEIEVFSIKDEKFVCFK